MIALEMSNRYAIVLGVLALAFLLRVIGQMLVAFIDVRFLPPIHEWQSGLLPYPLLLSTQFLILTLQVRISRDVWRGTGFFAIRRWCTGRNLCWFSYVYFAMMLLRYVVTMWLYPEWRWFHGTIPIFFHWVLAAYLFVLGKYFQSSSEPLLGS